MLSLFFKNRKTKTFSLLRFDVLETPLDRNGQRFVSPSIAFEAYAIYDHDAKQWVKYMLDEITPPQATEQGTLPCNLVPEADHTFFTMQGLIWHIWTDERFHRDIRGRALHMCILGVDKAHPSLIDTADAIALVRVLKSGGRAELPNACTKAYDFYPV